MSLVRKFAVVVLTVLLVSTLVTGNLLAAAHLTVLDPGFVQNTIEEEGGYEIVEDATVEAADQQVQNLETGGSTDISAIVDTEGLVRDAIDKSYLQEETESNVDSLYAYLHGNSEEPDLSVDTGPLKTDIEAAIETQIQDATVAELLEATDTDLNSLAGSELPVEFDQSTVEQMTTSQSGYQAVRQDIRQQLREEVLDSLVQQAWEETTNDEKLALVIPDYNPREYSDAEKERMVADREPEIRAALRERIVEERGDQIDQRIDERLAEANETLAPEPTGDESAIEAATIEIQAAFVAGLTTDMSYEEFRTDLDDAKADAATAVGDRAGQQLDQELEDEISLTEGMDAGTEQALKQGQTAVTWLDRLAIIVPLFALVLVGLVYFATRSGQTVASSLGFALVFAGLPIYLSLGFLQSMVEQSVEDQLASGEASELVEAGADLALGIVAQLFGRVGTVSLAFVIAGVALLAVWLALRYGVIGGADDEGQTAAEAAAAADAEAMDDEEPGDDADATDEADGDAATAVADDSTTDDVADDGPTIEESAADTDDVATAGDDSGDPLSDVADDGDEE